MKARDEIEIPSDERLSIGYFSSNGLSRSNSSQNINFVPDPASLLMQSRIDDLETGFKQLDRRTDDLDYDIETIENVTAKLRICYDDVHEDIQVVRDEMMDLLDRLDAIGGGMAARMKKCNTRFESSLYPKSYMGSKYSLTGASKSDLRGSNYALDKTYSTKAFNPIPSPKEPRALSPESYTDFTPDVTPSRSPLSSPKEPRALSPEPYTDLTPPVTPSRSPVSSPPRSPVSSPPRSPVSSPPRSPVSTPPRSPPRSPVYSPSLSPARSEEAINDNDYLSDSGSDY